MDIESLKYFCAAQAKLNAVCIRIYKDDSQTEMEYFFGSNYAGNDINSIPLNMSIDSFDKNKTISIYDETQFLLGAVKDNETGKTLLIGPVRLREITQSNITEVMRKYSLPKLFENSISRFLLSTPVIPIDNFLTMLSLFNLYVNGTIISVDEILQSNGEVLSVVESKENFIETVDVEMPHTTGDYEENVIYFIKNGMVEEIEKLHFENYTGTMGKLGPNQLRSLKNALIILNSMCLRAAISGGLDTETAYTLGERYLQRIENAQSISDLGKLSPMIRKDYCLRVKNLTAPKIDNLYIQKATEYIQNNIYTKITVAQLAQYVGIKPEYLSALSQQTLKCTMSQYIVQRKISEAKKLLRFTDKSLAEIANLLCFSSQSHFQNHFKKVRGITPTEYRKKYNKKSTNLSVRA